MPAQGRFSQRSRSWLCLHFRPVASLYALNVHLSQQLDPDHSALQWRALRWPQGRTKQLCHHARIGRKICAGLCGLCAKTVRICSGFVKHEDFGSNCKLNRVAYDCNVCFLCYARTARTCAKLGVRPVVGIRLHLLCASVTAAQSKEHGLLPAVCVWPRPLGDAIGRPRNIL